MTNLINCGTCGYPLTPEERTTLVEHNGVMVKPMQEPVGFAVMQKPWVGLTDGDIDECYSRDPRVAARNAEAKLKEKNT